MTTALDDMWVTASADHEAEQTDRLLAVARVRCAELWPFLAGAGTEAEYVQRRALAADRIEQACDSVAPGDPTVVEAVLTGLDSDFLALHAARAPERELAGRVEGELRRRALHPDQARAALHAAWEAVGVTSPTDQHSSREASDFVAWYARKHLPGARTVAELPDPHGEWARFVRDRHAARLTTARALRARLARVAHLRQAEVVQPDTEGQPPVEPDEVEQALSQPEPLSVGAPRTATSPAPMRATCSKCVAGQTPDGAACGYCDGAAELDPVTAMVKAADGWDQGLVRLTATGAVSFDPLAFGSERWQKLPRVAAPDWIVDQWGATNTPLEGAEPNPLANRAAPSGRELADTRSYRPPVRAVRKRANPYLDENPYRSDGPGSVGPNTNPDDSDPPGETPQPEETPLDSGAAQPEVRDERPPHPKDEVPNRPASTTGRRVAPEFAGRPPDVVDRLAARVLAANADCTPADARRVALATLRRFPAVAPKSGNGQGEQR